MPHPLIPPDLQMILDWNDAPVLWRGTTSTFLVSRPWTPANYYTIVPVLAAMFGAPHYIPRIPANTRAITLVCYRPAVDKVTYVDRTLGLGVAYLSADDIFREEVGIVLATLRATADLLNRRKPKNSLAIAKRIGRFVERLIAQGWFDGIDDSTVQAIYTAWLKVEETGRKCQK